MEQASQVIVLASALLIWAAMSRSCCHSSCAMPGGSRASRTCSCGQVNPSLQSHQPGRFIHMCYALRLQRQPRLIEHAAPTGGEGTVCREWMYALCAGRLQRQPRLCTLCVFLQAERTTCAGNGRVPCT